MIFISDEEQKTIDDLKEELAAKEQKLKNQAEELDYLTNKVVPDFKKENKELKELKIELTDALEETTKKYFDQLDINATLSDSVTRKGADLHLAKVRLDEIEKELLKMEEEGIEEIPKEIEEDTDDLSDELNKKEEKINDIKKQLDKKDKELKEKIKELTHLNDEIIPKLKTEIANTNKELKDFKDSINNKKDDSKLQIAKLENKIKDLEADVLKRTQNNDRLQNELSSKDKLINKLEEKNKNLSKSLKEKSDKGFFAKLRG